MSQCGSLGQKPPERFSEAAVVGSTMFCKLIFLLKYVKFQLSNKPYTKSYPHGSEDGPISILIRDHIM